ncbi:hypothetical protein [Solibacillus sp. FSL K6-1523]|uniref:hypothetical protein n=1 Tax=Solibacillus sp. FSL K6-1523 TaxID=2921471 RepID=UPI0030FA0AAA
MNNNKPSKLNRLRAKYAALFVALGCLYSFVNGFGENWFMTILLGSGVLICGLIAFFDITRARR